MIIRFYAKRPTNATIPPVVSDVLVWDCELNKPGNCRDAPRTLSRAPPSVADGGKLLGLARTCPHTHDVTLPLDLHTRYAQRERLK